MVALASKQRVKPRWFQVVFYSDSMVVYTIGINSQHAISNACEALLSNTGEDYRRVPCVASELEKSRVKQ